MSSVYKTMIEAVAQRITDDVPLQNMPPDRVHTAKFPWDHQSIHRGKLPCVVVSTFGQVRLVGGSNGRERLAYPVAIVVLHADNRNHELDDVSLEWAEIITSWFIRQRLPGVHTVISAEIDRRDTMLMQAFVRNLDASAQVFRFENVELRRRSQGTADADV